MVAVTLLAVAIVAPMSLTAQSLSSAYYARDQITAFYLAQEALEAVRNVRDNNILANSQGTSVNLLNGIPINIPFRIDARTNPPTMTPCSADGGTCIPLQTDGTLYGYGGWANTQFTRTVNACFIQADASCTSAPTDEVKVTSTIVWRSVGLQERTVAVSENLYRWVNDGSAAQ
jgi:Tfp pilus assembly protein PilV